MANWPVVGVDVSQWQGAMNWATTAKKAQFAYVKATENKQGIDPRFSGNWSGAKAAGLVRGAFHFFRAHRDATSPKKQAENFAAVLGNDLGELPPMLDVETNDDGLTKNEFVDRVTKFLVRFLELTGKECGIYTSIGAWDSYVASAPGNTDIPRILGAGQRMLWVANYTSGSAPLIPFDWSKRYGVGCWNIWQHSADGNGRGSEFGASSDSIDLDRFNGSVSDFNQRFGTHILPLPGSDPVQPPSGNKVVVSVDNLNVRSAPVVSSANDIGDLHKGAKLTVLEDLGEWLRIEAYVYQPYTRPA